MNFELSDNGKLFWKSENASADANSQTLYSFSGLSFVKIWNITEDTSLLIWHLKEALLSSPADFTHLLSFRFCSLGRRRLSAEEGSPAFYETAGDLSVCSFDHSEPELFSPGADYEGAELLIRTGENDRPAAAFSRFFSSPVKRLRNLYPAGTCFIAGPAEEAVSLMGQILSLGNAETSGDFFVLRQTVQEFLRLCVSSVFKESGRKPVPPAVEAIARESEGILTKDLRQVITASSMAEKYGISETGWKNCFRAVYGQNHSVYMRQTRIRQACMLLEDSDLSIGEISNQVGYLNQGKFAGVFKKEMGLPPWDYRLKCRYKDVIHGI